jgi:hypothetical protein
VLISFRVAIAGLLKDHAVAAAYVLTTRSFDEEPVHHVHGLNSASSAISPPRQREDCRHGP